MHRNIKTMFLLTTLVFLLVSITAITASEVDNQTAHKINSNTPQKNKELSTNTQLIKTNENKNIIKTKKDTTKENTEDITTQLTLKFIVNPDDEYQTEGYLTTHKYKNYTLDITLTEDEEDTPIGGNIQLYLSDEAEPIEITLNETGHIQQTYTAQTIGTSNIYAIFEGYDKYQAATSDPIILSVEQITPTITINKIENPCYNSTITINGTLNTEDQPMKNKNLTIYFNNNKINTAQTDNEGKYSYQYNLENIDIQKNAIISVIYEADDDGYTDAYNEEYFDIEKIKNNITITQILNPETYNKVIIKGSVTDENNKNFEGIINASITDKNTGNEVYNNSTIYVEDGQYTFTFIPENSGLYELTLITQPDNYYIESIKKQEINIDKATLRLNLEESYDALVKENITINGTLQNRYNLPISNVEIIISTDTEELGKTTTNTEGKFNFTQYTFQEIVEDTFITLYFTIIENNNLYQLNDESSIYITLRNTNVSLQILNNAKINGTLEICGEVKDSYNESLIPEGTVTLYLNNQKIKDNIELNNGEYQSLINIPTNYLAGDELQIEAFFKADNPNVYYSDLNYADQSTTVEIIETNITIDSTDSYVEKTVNITVNLSDEYHNRLNKTVTLKIIRDSEEIMSENLELVGGTINLTFTPHMEGTYLLIAQYAGEENIYSESLTDYPINIQKTPSQITLNPITNIIYVNDTIKITGKLTDSEDNPLENEYINIILNSTNENRQIKVKTDTLGIYEYNYTPTHENKINITVEFEQTTSHDASYTNITLTTHKHNTTTIIDQINPEYKYRDIITITGRVIEKTDQTPVNGSITIKINNQSLETITLNNGEFTKDYKNMEVGKNINITVIFNQNEAYDTSNKTLSYDTEALNTTIILNPINPAQINTTINITGYVTDENNNRLNGTIKIKINTQQIEDKTLNNGSFSFNYTTTTIGTNTINITYTQDELHYHTTKKTETFQVTRTNLEIKNLQIETDDENKSIIITGKLVNNNNISTSNIKLNIFLNNKNYTVTTKENGEFTLKTDKLIADEYNIGLRINQTEYFNKVNMDLGKVNITKYTPTINLKDIPTATYSKNLTIEGNLTDNYNKALKEQNLIIRVNNKQYSTTTDSQGRYNITIKDFNAGINTVKITVPETTYTYKANLTTSFTANKDTASIILDNITNPVPGETITIRGNLINSENQSLTNKTVKITINNKTHLVSTDNQGIFTLNFTDTKAGSYEIKTQFEDSNHIKTTYTKTVTINKLNVTLTVNDVVARVGEYITFIATLKDQNNNPVSGGNLVFKLNGRTLRTDGRFDTNTKNVLKFKVNNGTVEYTLTADLYLRHGKNISASYSGSYKYESAKSNTALASIQLRYSNMNTTSSIKTVKHHNNITFIAKLADVTPNSNKSLINSNASVIFKINGVSIKDKQNKIIKVPVKNNTATLNYNITSMAGIDKDYKIRNYTVTAVYANPNYYPVNNRNTTTFNVERSPVTINIEQASVNNSKLNLKAKITDYLGYNVMGENKLCIKINGVTYKENNLTRFYTVENGEINIKNIDVKDMKVKSIEIVTGERLAYLSARQKYTNIVY